ncbi:MAG: PTS transporter subunit IIC [Roseiarcus sp.]|jgi:PTS system galactitol-specific IIC component
MDSFLVALKAVVDGLGATVLLPIVIFVIALILGAKPGRAFRAGVMIGVAFIGINLIIGLMWTSLSDVSHAMVVNTGIKRDIVDVGWPSAAAIAFGSSVGLWVIPVAIAVNIVLLFAKLTRTLNVDVWNFWHFAFVGSLVVAATNSLPMGICAAAVMTVIALFFADWTAKGVQRFYGIPGVSITTLASSPVLLIAIVVNWVIELIPGLRDIHLDTDTIQRRLGVVGEPVVMGLVIGLVLGVLGYWNIAPADMVTKVLKTGMSLAAVMVLLPRMVKILMEGLIPVAEAAREFIQKRSGGQATEDQGINIGLDSAILIGHPAAISSALLLVPIAILLSVILPGNRVILFADLAVIPFIVALTAPLLNGNVLRMVIVGTVTLLIGFYFAMYLAPLFTSAAVASGFKLPENATMITSIADGFLWPPSLTVALANVAGYGGIALLLLVTLVAIWFFRRNEAAWERLAGSEDTTAADQSVPVSGTIKIAGD